MCSTRPQPQPRSRTFVARLLCLLLLGILFSVGTSGCNIGVKESIRVVYVGYGEAWPVNGAIRIATSDPIHVTVDDGKDKDIATKLNLGGYYAVSEADMKAFLAAVRKQQ